MPAPATLTFTVNTFRPYTSGTTLTLMTTTGGDVSIAVSQPGRSGNDPTVSLINNNTGVGVARSSAGGNQQQTLVIQVTGYTPVGLVFKPSVSGGSSPFGAYTRGSGNNNVLTVVDTDSGSSTWEFFILIQAANGDFGLIDPVIQNS